MSGRNVLLAVGGGIAAYKTPELARALVQAGHCVRAALTPAAREFVSPLTLQTLTGAQVRSSLFDPGEEGRIGHIELADFAELVVVAPATADLLARMAHGLADDLVTTLLLATRAPLLLAPAMNVNMWEHPATRANVERLTARGAHFVGPETGALACGYEGEGRMSEARDIAARVELLLGAGSLAGEKVVVTAGGTQEAIDAVRVLANRSSGKMGYALAAEAARRGAEVELVSAPTALPVPAGVHRVSVESALEMQAALRRAAPGAGIIIMSAAVADFRPSRRVEGKIKKEELVEGADLQLTLTRTPDLLAELCRENAASAGGGRRIVVGFAAESGNLEAAARRKLAQKGCDLLVANDISRSDTGFGSEHNAVLLLGKDGEQESLPLMPKTEVAAQILDRVEKLRGVRT